MPEVCAPQIGRVVAVTPIASAKRCAVCAGMTVAEGGVAEGGVVAGGVVPGGVTAGGVVAGGLVGFLVAGLLPSELAMPAVVGDRFVAANMALSTASDTPLAVRMLMVDGDRSKFVWLRPMSAIISESLRCHVTILMIESLSRESDWATAT